MDSNLIEVSQQIVQPKHDFLFVHHVYLPWVCADPWFNHLRLFYKS
jgi:hypothetical protein